VPISSKMFYVIASFKEPSRFAQINRLRELVSSEQRNSYFLLTFKCIFSS